MSSSPSENPSQLDSSLLPRLHAALQQLKTAFVGKDEVIDLLGLGLVSGENVFLHGPPGTAKSALVKELGRRLEATSFDYLLTRFTEPNELFGPFDIRKLREGDLVTNTDGMMPEADLVFLDELLNANSAILNSLLMALNERMFRRGRETRRLPALFFVAASNHLPEDETLRALYDRFLLRVRSVNVPDDALGQVLQAGWQLEHAAQASAQAAGGLTAESIRSLQSAVARVDLSGTQEGYLELIKKLRAAGFALSDRRVVKYQRVIAASALMGNRWQSRPSDLWVLRHTWDTEEQQEVLRAIVDGVIAQSEPLPDDHPRARYGQAPDPEALAAEIRHLMAEIETPTEGQKPVGVLQDRLQLVSSRIPWVANETQRVALETLAAAVWVRLQSAATLKEARPLEA